jgi:hypothetical protein
VRSILHYLERVEQGEPNYEDRTKFPAGLNEGVKVDQAKDQDALYQTLYAVLKREARSTMEGLYQIYGVGTDAPSRFGLMLVSRMQFRESCAALLQSERLLKQSPAESFSAPREELEATIHALNCQ